MSSRSTRSRSRWSMSCARPIRSTRRPPRGCCASLRCTRRLPSRRAALPRHTRARAPKGRPRPLRPSEQKSPPPPPLLPLPPPRTRTLPIARTARRIAKRSLRRPARFASTCRSMRSPCAWRSSMAVSDAVPPRPLARCPTALPFARGSCSGAFPPWRHCDRPCRQCENRRVRAHSSRRIELLRCSFARSKPAVVPPPLLLRHPRPRRARLPAPTRTPRWATALRQWKRAAKSSKSPSRCCSSRRSTTARRSPIFSAAITCCF